MSGSEGAAGARRRALIGALTPVSATCLLVLLAILVIVVLVPWIVPHGEGQILTDESFAPPGSGMLLGSDYLGRDLLSRLMYGARLTLGMALAISLLGFAVGTAAGFLVALSPRWIDAVAGRAVDGVASFPSIMLTLIVITALGPSFPVLILTVAAIDATRVFRVARALGMSIAMQDFVEAARARGERLGWIIWQELLPNALGPLAAELGIRLTYAILFVSALSFLGLGVQPPHADLGLMVKENAPGLLYGSFAPLWPALAIAIVTISVNLVIDSLFQGGGVNLPEEL